MQRRNLVVKLEVLEGELDNSGGRPVKVVDAEGGEQVVADHGAYQRALCTTRQFRINYLD